MNPQCSLFSTESIPLAEQIQMLHKQLNEKCETYNVTFGIFKAKKGPIDHNAMVVITDKSGRHFTSSFNAENIHHLVTQVNDAIKSLNNTPDEKNSVSGPVSPVA